MKIDEIRRLSPDELAAQLLQLKKEQFNLRFQAATSQLEKKIGRASCRERVSSPV